MLFHIFIPQKQFTIKENYAKIIYEIKKNRKTEGEHYA